MQIRRRLIWITTIAVTLGGLALSPVGTASALHRECTWVPKGPIVQDELGVFNVTYEESCVDVQDPWDVLPPGGGPRDEQESPDPGAGSGGRNEPKPGSTESCTDAASQLADANARAESNRQSRVATADEVKVREADFATAVRGLNLAIGRTALAASQIEAAIVAFEAEYGEIEPGPDNLGKPRGFWNFGNAVHTKPIRDAQRAHGDALIAERTRRSLATSTAVALNAARDHLSRLERDYAAVEKEWIALEDRLRNEGC